MYADFLDEAAFLLEKKSIQEAAEQFRLSHARWIEFANALLPKNVAIFHEAKTLLFRRHKFFVQNGENAQDEIVEINARLKEIEVEMGKKFPLSETETAGFRSDLREHVFSISAIERKAVELLQGIM